MVRMELSTLNKPSGGPLDSESLMVPLLFALIYGYYGFIDYEEVAIARNKQLKWTS